MKQQIEQVKEWHEKFNAPVANEPIMMMDNDRRRLRHKILLEEVNELDEAIFSGDVIETLDALADVLFVLFGTAVETGLWKVLPEAYHEVCRSNMSKLGEDGKPILREDGKILKGPNFTEPDFMPLLKQYL